VVEGEKGGKGKMGRRRRRGEEEGGKRMEELLAPEAIVGVAGIYDLGATR